MLNDDYIELVEIDLILLFIHKLFGLLSLLLLLYLPLEILKILLLVGLMPLLAQHPSNSAIR